MGQMEKYTQAADYIKAKIGIQPEVAVVLGSGLGDYTSQLKNTVEIPYSDIPNFPLPKNENHKGVLYAGLLDGKPVILMAGRFHHYEGYSFEQCAIYVPVFMLLGVKTLIVTNAAGGVNASFKPGDLMLISDHIKLTSQSPCMGMETGLFGRPRFFDVSNVYTATLREKVRAAASKLGQELKEGVYMYFGGPQFETPAEVRLAGLLGADAVGMSTVPEAIMAAYCGLQVIGISCISNMAAGISKVPLSDDDVREVAAMVGGRFAALLNEVIASL